MRNENVLDGVHVMTKKDARWLGEFVGGPYDGLTLTTDGTEPPATLTVDRDSPKFVPNASGKGFKIHPFEYAKGHYENVLSMVVVDGEFHDIYSLMSAADRDEMLDDAEEIDGRTMIRCKYEWNAGDKP